MTVIETAAIAAGVGALLGGGLGTAMVLKANPVEEITDYMVRTQQGLLTVALLLAHVGLTAVLWGVGESLLAILLFNVGLAGMYTGSILYTRRWRRFGKGKYRSVDYRVESRDVLDLLMFSTGGALVVLAWLL